MATRKTVEKSSAEKSAVRVRVEIIFSQALEEDFQEEFKDNHVGSHYTKLFPVMGAGFSNPRLGDAIWPQLNMMYIIYCDEAEAETIKMIISKLRVVYKDEGIACFISQADEY